MNLVVAFGCELAVGVGRLYISRFVGWGVSVLRVWWFGFVVVGFLGFRLCWWFCGW